jgi:hypothetical protein
VAPVPGSPPEVMSWAPDRPLDGWSTWVRLRSDWDDGGWKVLPRLELPEGFEITVTFQTAVYQIDEDDYEEWAECDWQVIGPDGGPASVVFYRRRALVWSLMHGRGWLEGRSPEDVLVGGGGRR